MKAENDNERAIENEGDYKRAVRTLDQKKRPAAILRLIMNALEAYRQARKMGWSRPQNKYGLTVFQSFAVDVQAERALIDQIFAAAHEELTELTDEERAFVRALSEDPGLMAFVFVHDLEEDGRRFEGLTFSLGRRTAHNPRFRDRFDLILDAEVIDGRSMGLTRVRGYVDPFRQPVRDNPARVIVHEPPQAEGCAGLFERAEQLYAAWLERPETHWAHWTTEYIDYFGPRRRPVEGTRFPTEIDAIAARRSA